MLILIISMLVTVVGIIAIAIGCKNYQDGLEIGGAIITTLGGIAIIVCITMAIASHINVEYKYQKDYMKYEILQEQIDSGRYDSTTITSEIISYNIQVMDYKKYYNSPWVGLYFYEGCEKLPLLEINNE